MTITSNIATNIQFLRKQMGLSQAALAQQLNMTRSKIASYENGNAEPNALKLLALSRFFQVGISQLIEADLRLLKAEGLITNKPQASPAQFSPKEDHLKMINYFEEKKEKLQQITAGFNAFYELEWSTLKGAVLDVTPLLKSYENVLLVLDSLLRSNEEVIDYIKQKEAEAISAQ